MYVEKANFKVSESIIDWGIENLKVKRGDRTDERIWTNKSRVYGTHDLIVMGHRCSPIIEYSAMGGRYIYLQVPKTELRKSYRAYKELVKLYREATKEEPVWPEPPILEPQVMDTIESYLFNFWKAIQQVGTSKGFGNRGMIFCGPPGTGKSLTMSYISTVGYRIFDHNTYHMGVSELMKLIDNGREFPGESIIFIDDADATLLMDRRKTKNPYTSKLLSCIDGTRKVEGRLIVISTNEAIKDIDVALRRPGRLDTTLVFDYPSNDLMDIFIKRKNVDLPAKKFYGWNFPQVDRFFQVAKAEEIMHGTGLDMAYSDFVKQMKEQEKVEKQYLADYENAFEAEA